MCGFEWYRIPRKNSMRTRQRARASCRFRVAKTADDGGGKKESCAAGTRRMVKGVARGGEETRLSFTPDTLVSTNCASDDEALVVSRCSNTRCLAFSALSTGI